MTFRDAYPWLVAIAGTALAGVLVASMVTSGLHDQEQHDKLTTANIMAEHACMAAGGQLMVSHHGDYSCAHIDRFIELPGLKP